MSDAGSSGEFLPEWTCLKDFHLLDTCEMHTTHQFHCIAKWSEPARQLQLHFRGAWDSIQLVRFPLVGVWGE